MIAEIQPLRGKYYATYVTVSDSMCTSEITICHHGDWQPSDRQLAHWGLTRKQWDANELVDAGDGIVEGCRSVYQCDSHCETQASYEIAQKIIKALTD